MSTRLIIALLACLGLGSANFTADFSAFLEETYGSTIRTQLERLDLADYGSFGGKVNRNDALANQPLIIVHGAAETAGDKPLWAAAWFRQNASYQNNEIYATTYANGTQGDPLKWLSYSMKCEYVKQIRNLIVAVNAYTGQKVDVLAYSLGVTISRKAILGGSCVDTSENIGTRLTSIVDSFVAVAGPNRGASFCGFGAPNLCNNVDGLYANCLTQSEFLKDINNESHYEADYIYTIYTKLDDKIGYSVCAKKTSPLENQNGEKEFNTYNHNEVFTMTHETQVSMFKNHNVV